jgi:hypothetical protein
LAQRQRRDQRVALFIIALFLVIFSCLCDNGNIKIKTSTGLGWEWIEGLASKQFPNRFSQPVKKGIEKCPAFCPIRKHDFYQAYRKPSGKSLLSCAAEMLSAASRVWTADLELAELKLYHCCG